MRAGRWVVLGIAPVLAWASAARAEPDVSGSYVGVSEAAAIMIQLVETPDGQVSGHYEALNFAAGGQLVDRTATLDGAAHAGVLVVRIRVSDGRSPISASGSVSGGALHIAAGTAPGDLNLTLRLGDEAAFNATAAALHQQAAQLASAQAEQRRVQEQVKSASDFLAAAGAFAVKQERYADEAGRFASAYPDISRRYAAFTQAMQAGLNRERSIVGNGQANLERGQVAMTIRQAAMEAKLFHSQVIARHNDDGMKLNQLAQQSADTRQRCGPPNAEVSTCVSLAASTNRLSSRTRDLQVAFDASEGVWREQGAAQEAIVRRAGEIQQQ